MENISPRVLPCLPNPYRIPKKIRTQPEAMKKKENTVSKRVASFPTGSLISSLCDSGGCEISKVANC